MNATCCSAKRGRGSKIGLPLAFGLLLALAPKCPLCLAGYLSVVGVGVAGAGALSPFVLPLGLALIALAGVIALRELVRSRDSHPS